MKDSKFESYVIHEGDRPIYTTTSPSIITKDGVVLERFWQHNGSFHSGYEGLWKELLVRSVLLPFRYGLDVGHRKDRVLVFENSWSAGYYHWLIEALPRLIALRKYFGLLPVAFSGRLPNNWFYSWLRDISGSKLIDYSGRGGILTAGAVFSQNPSVMSEFYREELLHFVEFVRSSILDGPSDFNVPRKIYISRKSATHRRFSNEDVAEKFFEKCGYKVVELQKLSFPEQVRLFSDATDVAAIHGAGLSNIIFMKPGTSVIEFIQEPDVEFTWGSRRKTHLLNPCFKGLADVFNINYVPVFSKLDKAALNGDVKSKYGTLHADLIFDKSTMCDEI